MERVETMRFLTTTLSFLDMRPRLKAVMGLGERMILLSLRVTVAAFHLQRDL
jgi:hypothetical protein